MTILLGPVPCKGCGTPVELRRGGRWYVAGSDLLHLHGPRVEHCGCGGLVVCRDGDIRAAIERHLVEPVHGRWRMWREAA